MHAQINERARAMIGRFECGSANMETSLDSAARRAHFRARMPDPSRSEAPLEVVGRYLFAITIAIIVRALDTHSHSHINIHHSPAPQARIAVLVGERKGQESLKSDLIRRIKMLEYALKQERANYHRLKFGCEMPTMNDLRPPTDGDGTGNGSGSSGVNAIGNEVAPDSEVPFSSVSNTTWRQGRTMLRSYLQEIGYTDTIIDVRSNRVRAMLGLNNNNAANSAAQAAAAAAAAGHGGGGGGGEGGGSNSMDGDNNASAPSVVNGNDNGGGGVSAQAAAAAAATKRAANDGAGPGRRTPAKKPGGGVGGQAATTVAEAEAAVLATLEFLDHTDVGIGESDFDDFGGLEVTAYDNDDVTPFKRKTKGKSEGEFLRVENCGGLFQNKSIPCQSF